MCVLNLRQRAGKTYADTRANKRKGRVGAPLPYANPEDKQKGPYKALLKNFGKPGSTDYHYLDVPAHRSTYCLKMRRLGASAGSPKRRTRARARA